MRTFEQAMRASDFAITAELPLKPATTAADLGAALESLGPLVDAVHVTESPLGIPHMSPLVAAGLCLQRGVDPVMHLSGRDRNRIALQSDLLGAAALGVTSLYLLRGDKLPAALKPRAQKVYEFGAKRLLRAASLIGGEPGLPPVNGFYLGSPVRVIAPPADWQPTGLTTKADVGCRFVVTQPLLEVERLRAYMQRLVSSRVVHRLSVIASVPVPTSLAALAAVRAAGCGALLPAGIDERLAAPTPAGTRAAGIAIAAGILDALTAVPGIAGAHLAGYEDTAAVAEAISQSGIRA